MLIVITPFLMGQSKQKMLFKLKNGSEVTGKILEESTATVKFKTTNNNTWVFNREDILSIEKAKTVKPISKGFTHTASIGLMFGRSEYFFANGGWGDEPYYTVQSGISLQSFNGYQINRHFALGLYSSIDLYIGEVVNLYLPLGLSARGYIGKNARLFYGLDIGQGFLLASDTFSEKPKNGLFLQPSIGFRLPSKTNKGVFIQTGLKKQRYTFEDRWHDWHSRKRHTYNRWFISIGTFL